VRVSSSEKLPAFLVSRYILKSPSLEIDGFVKREITLSRKKLRIKPNHKCRRPDSIEWEEGREFENHPDCVKTIGWPAKIQEVPDLWPLSLS
jgi:hypothetical protein